LLAELPKPDESTAPLPNPPARPRSSYRRDRRLRLLLSSIAWLVIAGGVAAGAYIYFNRSPHTRAAAPVLNSQTAMPATTPQADPSTADPSKAVPSTAARATATPAGAAPVQVSLTASERAWVQVSVDGKTTFIGTLTPNETREISAAEQVKVLTGNAGALTISLNGKTLESLGPRGHMGEVRLTAEGPQLLSKDPPPAPDPL
jgi:cytoskeleton protein RodZ